MNNEKIELDILPESVKRIKRVNIKQNLYERHHIEKAGYTEISRRGNDPKVGWYTVWKNTTIFSGTLIFLEREDGFYKYVGISDI
ncbi:hypothetical protein ABEV54_07050 [Peribacillus psychrosaccharolyticus]|uniref:hypothetical protein n=1 Tax=Peribacillus psychrosaccharolyticus TaxID=1407 RepID=UPI003D2B1C67